MDTSYCTEHLRSMADTLDLIGGKWKLLILVLLADGTPRRFGEMERALGRITPRMLSKELKDLEQNQLVERRVYPTVPAAVEYRLTDYGLTLSGVMTALGDWGKLHRRRIMQPAEPA
jgi:DNA-binding HxlR family transcriptional regulator